MTAKEVNFDGIVGPTHNYAGLSYGNLASTRHQNQVSSPRQAALQGLNKMKFVHDLGVSQAVLPPLRRPHLETLQAMGFQGSPGDMIQAAWKANPALVAACYSASSMWTANAATVSPSADCRDGRVHITPANLASGFHRSMEVADTTRVLQSIFADEHLFRVHPPLPSTPATSDEGAANHTRLGSRYERPGIETFVFGRSAMDQSLPRPEKFPARQTLEASRAIIRRHELDPEQTMLIQQAPEAIDAGVFHNDVISVGNLNVLLVHEFSFRDTASVLQSLQQMAEHQGWQLFTICFTEQELPLPDAVTSYLFNSQLLSRPDGAMTLVCPVEVADNPLARRCVERLIEEANPVDQVEYLDLRQSMNNGGGPACLRLRVVLTEQELNSIHQSVRFDETLYERLTDWVKRNYREALAPDDLRDPRLIEEVNTAFCELQEILELPYQVFRF